ncbi:MAG: histidine phosphatase family protein [Syntrophales bacterium]|nr:histidine phosphatase family protein [Syntrophales bacterium]MDD5232400.1 histidine phosphatase family protein [Syntrophales bacterium]
MTIFILIRHAMCDEVGVSIAGRSTGVSLNRTGREQARELAERLAHLPIGGIFCSPLERACETARSIAERTGARITISRELDEIDFGDWTGCGISSLSGNPAWRGFNDHRSTTRIPGGEMMIGVQHRIITELDRIRAEFPGRILAIVSHGDVIKSAILYYAGIPLDFIERIEIAPASASGIRLGDGGPRILGINTTGRIDWGFEH